MSALPLSGYSACIARRLCLTRRLGVRQLRSFATFSLQLCFCPSFGVVLAHISLGFGQIEMSALHMFRASKVFPQKQLISPDFLAIALVNVVPLAGRSSTYASQLLEEWKSAHRNRNNGL